MTRLSYLLITLPLLGSPVSLLGAKHLAAATASPLEALGMLARSSAIESKCRMLDTRERYELNGYLARAEVASAARYPIEDAKSAVASGRRQGEAAACSANSQRELRDTLGAAREAMAKVKSRSLSSKKINALTARSLPRSSARTSRGSLEAYENQAMAYFVERRCRHLGNREVRDFWLRIVRDYQAAVRAHGLAIVRHVQNEAEAQAENLDCNGSSVRLVRAAYTQSRVF
jgi:hypothetical protein